jgi:hypothetical protein
MVSVIASSAVVSGFEPQSGQTKDYKIGICCLHAKHAVFRNKSKDWLAHIEMNLHLSHLGQVFKIQSMIKKG